MDPKKLRTLIDEKNEKIERDVLRTAEGIINEIISEQQRIKTAQERIAQLREELTTLDSEPVDPADILGN